MTVAPAAELTFSPADFLDIPTEPNPLIGSAETSEVFTASLDGFDCVTYIETIVALARACDVDDFVEWLRRIRYERGRIQWERRNHYMTLWIRNNVREGIIRPVSMPAVPIVSRERVLNVVPGLAARRTRVKCVPKPAVPRLANAFAKRRSDFFCVHAQESRCVSCWNHRARWQKHPACVTRRAARAWSWNRN